MAVEFFGDLRRYQFGKGIDHDQVFVELDRAELDDLVEKSMVAFGIRAVKFKVNNNIIHHLSRDRL